MNRDRMREEALLDSAAAAFPEFLVMLSKGRRSSMTSGFVGCFLAKTSYRSRIRALKWIDSV